MGESKNSKNLTTPIEKDGLLEEYRSLRNEILSAQGRRLQTISLTVGVLGVILSISANAVMGGSITTPEERLVVALGGAIALYAILIPSLIMVISLQQTVQRLGGYIRIFIEPHIPGLNWEHRWQDFKLQHQYPVGLRGVGAIYYFLLFLPLLLPLYTLSQSIQNWPLILILIPFIAWSTYLSYDLQAAISKSWKLARWDNYEESGSK
jgi:hypothetical protein